MTSSKLHSNTLPAPENILQHLYTGLMWVDDQFNIQWVNSQIEQVFSASQNRLIGVSILDILMSCETETTRHKVDLSMPALDLSASMPINDPSSQSHKSSDKSSNKIQRIQDRLQLQQQFINAKDYQQPFIEYSRHIVGLSEPIFVNYSVTPIEQDHIDLKSVPITSADKANVEKASADESSSTYYLIEIWEKNRQSRIDKEQRQQEQHDVARQMLRSVAHEVKNPLAGIRGAAQLLNRHTKRQLAKAKPQLSRSQYLNEETLGSASAAAAEPNSHLLLVDPKKLTTYTEIVISETDRLTDLIGQLLGSNKLPDWESVNIHEPLEHVLTLTQPQFPVVTIERDYDLSLPEITADKNQLIQVFLNLVNNACAALLEQDFNHHNQLYTPILRISTRIEHQYTIGTHTHKQVIKVCIHDNGPGIPTELIDRIFYPLVTGRANGTGLGLALVQEMIHHHQGAIEVTSKRGDTAFCIYLPFAQITQS